MAALVLAAAVPAGAAGDVFAPSSVWNEPVPADAPLDARSDQLAGALATEVALEHEARTGPWINTTSWSVPVYTVGPRTPRVRVILDTYKPELQRDFDAVPIPLAARPAAGGDGHMVVYQPATDTLWEFYRARLRLDGWHARWGGRMTGVSSNPGWFPAPYGATATGLPLLGGLMRTAELEAGSIDHALALAIPTTAADTYTFPAQRTDGRTTGPSAIPAGTRFRIDPSLDLGTLGLSPVGLAMARAAQRYGMVVRDTADVVSFYAEDPAATGLDPYGRLFSGTYPSEALRGFPWDRLEVVAPPAG